MWLCFDGAIAKLDEKYFGHVQNFDFVDTRTFLQRAKSLLPKYQSLFQTHAKNIDWRLLAAISRALGRQGRRRAGAAG